MGGLGLPAPEREPGRSDLERAAAAAGMSPEDFEAQALREAIERALPAAPPRPPSGTYRIGPNATPAEVVRAAVRGR